MYTLYSVGSPERRLGARLSVQGEHTAALSKALDLRGVARGSSEPLKRDVCLMSQRPHLADYCRPAARWPLVFVCPASTTLCTLCTSVLPRTQIGASGISAALNNYPLCFTLCWGVCCIQYVRCWYSRPPVKKQVMHFQWESASPIYIAIERTLSAFWHSICKLVFNCCCWFKPRCPTANFNGPRKRIKETGLPICFFKKGVDSCCIRAGSFWRRKCALSANRVLGF